METQVFSHKATPLPSSVSVNRTPSSCPNSTEDLHDFFSSLVSFFFSLSIHNYLGTWFVSMKREAQRSQTLCPGSYSRKWQDRIPSQARDLSALSTYVPPNSLSKLLSMAVMTLLWPPVGSNVTQCLKGSRSQTHLGSNPSSVTSYGL